MNNTIDFSRSCEPLELYQKFFAKYGQQPWFTKEWFCDRIEELTDGAVSSSTVDSWLRNTNPKKPKKPVKILLSYIEA